MAHAVDRALEDRHVRAEPERDHRGVVADDPAADHDDPAGRDAGDAAEQQAAPAERLLEEVGARLRGEPARRSRSSAPAAAARRFVGLDGLVGDAGRAALDERARQRLVAARWRYVKRTSPSRSRGYSAAIGSLTFSSSSASPQTSSGRRDGRADGR